MRIPYCNHNAWLCFLAFGILPGGGIHAQTQRKCAFDANSWTVKFQNVVRTSDTESVFYIPVVFHVVYKDENRKIPDEQIYSQLQVINEDFNRENEDSLFTHYQFASVAANVGIEFYLAHDNDLRGVTRTITTHGPFYNDELHLSEKGGRDAWDTKKYLNVWIADLAPGIFGYGTSPGTIEYKDGVAIHFEYFGRHENAKAPYNLGRTLTHEIGHWLGLLHPWGDGGCDSDDGLTDTPNQESPTFGCSFDQISCLSLDMVQNFMNTSDDKCMNLFTRQQKEVMRSTLMEQRPLVFSNHPLVTAIDHTVDPIALYPYPNPVTDTPYTYINVPEGNFKTLNVSITDLRGRQVRQYVIDKFGIYIPISLEGLNNGIYILQIDDDTSVYIAKIYLNK